VQFKFKPSGHQINGIGIDSQKNRLNCKTALSILSLLWLRIGKSKKDEIMPTTLQSTVFVRRYQSIFEDSMFSVLAASLPLGFNIKQVNSIRNHWLRKTPKPVIDLKKLGV